MGLMQEFQKARTQRRAEVGNRRRGIAVRRQELAADRAALGQELRATLASTAAPRRAEVAVLKQRWPTMRQGLASSYAATRRELRASLASVAPRLRAEVWGKAPAPEAAAPPRPGHRVSQRRG